jgi:hypothetical protein
MNKTLIIVIAIIILLTGGYFLLNQKSDIAVANFEECVAAGNPIMESYPERCMHDGETYVRVLSDDENTVTSADDAPPGSIHNLPVPEAVAAVKKHVAEKSSVREGLVIVMTAYEKEWSDGCLGLGRPNEGCIAVITPGYEVTVSVNGTEQTYRTNSDGTQIRMEK